MKRLLLQLSIVLVLPLIFSGLVSAQSFWRVEMSDPTTTDQQRNFNIEFTALSTDDSDQITVTLVQNGESLSSLTTAGGGGSGVFNITVPEDGVYSYRLDAVSSESGETRSTDTRIVSVSTPDDEITIIEVGPELTPDEEAALIGEGAAVADETEVEGEVTDEAAVTDDEAVLGETDEDEDGEVLGVEDRIDETAAGLIRNILLVVAVLGLVYYLFFRGRSPFNRSE